MEVIINSLKEEMLLVSIFPHFIGSIAIQLRELVMILANTHLFHPEVFEFLLFRSITPSKIWRA
jgi:hypothetical protein